MLAFQAPHKKIGPVIASSSGPVSLLLRATVLKLALWWKLPFCTLKMVTV